MAIDLSLVWDGLSPEQQRAILDGPALQAPDGVSSNLDDPSHNNVLAYAVVVTCLTTSVSVFMLRAYNKIFLTRRVAVGDVLCLVALVHFVAFAWNVFKTVHDANFRTHQWDIRVREAFGLLYTYHIGTNLYCITLLALKAAILLEWLSHFVPRGTGTRSGFWWACWTLMAVNTVFYVAVLFLENLQCRPFRKIWDRTVAGRCMPREPIDIGTAALNLALDVCIFFLPQPVIWRLHISTRKKVGISLIFAVGVFGIVTAVFRLVTVLQFSRSDDKAYTIGPLALWVCGEITVLFLAFCVPAAPLVFRRDRRGAASSARSKTPASGPDPSDSSRSGPRRSRYRNLELGHHSASRNGHVVDADVALLPLAAKTAAPREIVHACDAPGIVKTTYVHAYAYARETRDDDVAVAADEYRRQHPWVTDARS